ncbi:glycosyltransferase [Pueribacillus sp. YX66]|uniref:glycosyltransferase n=1 Tax=Pueribacillus sp. YX66 TaxID=3229242 RepID=UPI00358CFF3B
MKLDKVTIIIPVYNCEYVDQAIESALKQTYSNIEIIVVNDGSTQYIEKIERYKDKLKILHKENGGTASALNTGIEHSSGDYIAWLSADDLFYPDKTENQLQFMKEKNCSISYGGFVHINDSGQITSDMLGVAFSNRLSFLKAMKHFCPVNGCTVMLKKEVFEKCGLFNEAFPLAHDYEMWLRAVQYYDFHLFNNLLVKYRVHKEMGTIKYEDDVLLELKQLRSKYRSILNRLITEEKNKNL